jgi:hypothetical protein
VERLLMWMDDIFTQLVTMDYPDAIPKVCAAAPTRRRHHRTHPRGYHPQLQAERAGTTLTRLSDS